MAEEHFSDLAVMAMHYGERIPVDDVLHAFIQLHPHRLFKATKTSPLVATNFCETCVCRYFAPVYNTYIVYRV